MMNEKIFVTDMDDVLVDLLSEWVNTLNERYNLNVKPCEVTQWEMTVSFPSLTPEEVYAPLHERSLWKRVKPKNDAVDGIKKLINMGYKVYICTATSYRNVEPKLTECLFKHFDMFTYHDVIVCHNKSLINCSFILDDNPKNLKDQKAVKFLYDCPHNKDADESEFDFRVESFEEVIELLTEYDNA